MPSLAKRDWVPKQCENYIQEIAHSTSQIDAEQVSTKIESLVSRNREIHEIDCFNLNPATNVMNPRAEAVGRGTGFAAISWLSR